MNASKRPRLTLIGALGVLAGASLVAGCDNDSTVDVERARYATREECELDWARPDDCVFVEDGAQPASEAGSSAGGASGGTYGGGAHGGGGGGHWSGPYYTRSGTVYHYDGGESDERISTRHATDVTESHASANVLGETGRPGSISRGGFGESAHAGGGGGEGGGHGGGHGGGG